jgi:hypothetical protein
MSFLPAVKQQINKRPPNDPVRITLEYMVQHAVGKRNSVPLKNIVAYLQSRGVNITETGFQQSILSESRGADYFIGAGHRGYFLIDTIDDAREMKEFYDVRIRKEEQNRDNLCRQSTLCGWTL